MGSMSGNGLAMQTVAIDLVKCLWVNKAYIAVAFLAVQLALFMQRALRDGYFDTIPTLQVYTGRGDTPLLVHARSW